MINDFLNTEGLLDNLNISASGKQEARDLFINIMTGLKKSAMDILGIMAS